MLGENFSAEVKALMWHRTVAQTTSVTLHPLRAAEITCKITFLKCKSAFKLIKCTLALRVLVNLQNQDANQGCSLLKNEITPRSGGFYFKDSFARHTQNRSENKALSSHLSPFPPLGCCKNSREVLHPSLWWFGVCVAAKLRICCAELSANLVRFFSRRFTIFRP